MPLNGRLLYMPSGLIGSKPGESPVIPLKAPERKATSRLFIYRLTKKSATAGAIREIEVWGLNSAVEKLESSHFSGALLGEAPIFQGACIFLYVDTIVIFKKLGTKI